MLLAALMLLVQSNVEAATEQQKRHVPGRPWPKGVSGNPRGRQKGLPTRQVRALEIAAKATVEVLKADTPLEDVTALDVLRRLYQDPTISLHVRLEAARVAASYEQPRLSAVMTAEAKEGAAAVARRLEQAIARARGGLTDAPSVVVDGQATEIADNSHEEASATNVPTHDQGEPA